MSREGKITSDEKRPLAGSLLLAHPSLNDGIFRRSVILLPAHDENGSMGIVLNHPLRKRMADISNDLAFSPLADVPVYQGGPVASDKLLICAWRMHPQGLGFQLMFGIEPDNAIKLREEQGMELRAYYGYAGWSAGQLEGELRRDTWVVTPLLPHLLVNEDGGEYDESMWRKILGDMGDEWRLAAGEPDDPALN
ncbi:putative transcriptional regulator [Ereboglobus sp. PH5-5]|uniref:YqgE/AlgH family protein n=1 Tax=Ereboglobus TaxID=2028344 RepID=UPI001F3876E1|nr:MULTISPECIES: YqgE/AlgH family protein [Ereboglobus]MDF9832480.1 putative transcriptional regulator [Ereboglobus sp. PH5-5]